MGREMDWGFGVSTGKLLHTEWIDNEILLCRTGSCIPCSGINLNGKE